MGVKTSAQQWLDEDEEHGLQGLLLERVGRCRRPFIASVGGSLPVVLADAPCCCLFTTFAVSRFSSF